MAKPKNPILSLGARGTIGDALTYQKRGLATITRKKPIPAYRYSLPQAYQRWLYEDYAYLWTQQSEATKRQYAATGSRNHLTGFQYWMSYQLTNLPDIAGMWHLDRIINNSVIDFSKNSNHGTIFGASVTPAIINNGLFFDGINDYVDCGLHSSLYPDNFTFEVFINISALANWKGVFNAGYHDPTTQGIYSYIMLNGSIAFGVRDGTDTVTVTTPAATIVPGTWYHLAFTFDGAELELFIDSVSKGTSNQQPVSYNKTKKFYIAAYANTLYNPNGIYDHAIIYNRALDATEIKRHSERRYPP